MMELLTPDSPFLPFFVGGLLSSTRGLVEVSSKGQVTLEIRKPKNWNYAQTIEYFGKLQCAFNGVGTSYRDIETVAGRGLFVATDDDAILIMRQVHDSVLGSRGAQMKRIINWWDNGKPQAPLKALMKEVNDPLKPAVLKEKLDGEEACACCKAKKGAGKTLRACSGCHIPVYCSKECQKADWKSHKALCKATRQLAQINLM
ncbi:hypothetical protein NADE_005993 [Nannochloris sp. 'desiccata']|nr:hypothetical protein NADE_005993 [Chlorella desiccata (nom. nud.)]